MKIRDLLDSIIEQANDLRNKLGEYDLNTEVRGSRDTDGWGLVGIDRDLSSILSASLDGELDELRLTLEEES